MYDLEDRTFRFSKSIYAFSKKIPYSVQNDQILKQLIRSGSSVGANYIEANEAMSKKDFVYRIKICRKEAKETAYWLRLLEIKETEEHNSILNEANELQAIFGRIYRSSIKKK